MNIHQISAGPFIRIFEPVKIFFLSLLSSSSAMKGERVKHPFYSCNYDVGRKTINSTLRLLFPRIIVELLCAQLITAGLLFSPSQLASLFHHFTPVISQVKKSALCQFYMYSTCWQPAASQQQHPVIYLWWNPLRSCAPSDARLFAIIIVYHFSCGPREPCRESQTHGNARLDWWCTTMHHLYIIITYVRTYRHKVGE